MAAEIQKKKKDLGILLESFPPTLVLRVYELVGHYTLLMKHFYRKVSSLVILKGNRITLRLFKLYGTSQIIGDVEFLSCFYPRLSIFRALMLRPSSFMFALRLGKNMVYKL